MVRRECILKAAALGLVPAASPAAPSSLDVSSIEKVKVLADAGKYLLLKPAIEEFHYSPTSPVDLRP